MTIRLALQHTLTAASRAANLGSAKCSPVRSASRRPSVGAADFQDTCRPNDRRGLKTCQSHDAKAGVCDGKDIAQVYGVRLDSRRDDKNLVSGGNRGPLKLASWLYRPSVLGTASAYHSHAARQSTQQGGRKAVGSAAENFQVDGGTHVSLRGREDAHESSLHRPSGSGGKILKAKLKPVRAWKTFPRLSAGENLSAWRKHAGIGSWGYPISRDWSWQNQTLRACRRYSDSRKPEALGETLARRHYRCHAGSNPAALSLYEEKLNEQRGGVTPAPLSPFPRLTIQWSTVHFKVTIQQPNR